MFPFNVSAQTKIQPQVETQPDINPLSIDFTLYRPSDDVVEQLETQYATTQAQQKLKAQNNAQDTCSCVLYLKKKYGFQVGSVGFASNWPVNSKTGDIGEVIVFGSPTHVAYIIGFNAQGWIVDESNWVRCTPTNNRIVPYNDPGIKGYWIPN